MQTFPLTPRLHHSLRKLRTRSKSSHTRILSLARNLPNISRNRLHSRPMSGHSSHQPSQLSQLLR